ncbi:MAG: hypothetical protein EHM58_14680 [Ignavibacteriae bacterium]|nr:MAG: hypothetical protein EHM58_14680 [Ignavibacteriota bacterium]
MKKTIIVAFLLIISSTLVYSQVYFSTYAKKICFYNGRTEKYDLCEDETVSTLFKFNSSETMFEHTTPAISSSYYIDEKKYDDETGLNMFYVTSDVGNKYIFIIDMDNKEIRTLGQDKKTEELYIITWYVKSMWSDK